MSTQPKGIATAHTHGWLTAAPDSATAVLATIAAAIVAAGSTDRPHYQPRVRFTWTRAADRIGDALVEFGVGATTVPTTEGRTDEELHSVSHETVPGRVLVVAGCPLWGTASGRRRRSGRPVTPRARRTCVRAVSPRPR